MNTKPEAMTGKLTVGRFIIKYNTIFIFLVLVIISSFLSDAFLTATNVFNVLRQETPYLCLGIGMLVVLLTGGIDLSAGSVTAVSGMIMAMALVDWGMTSPLGFIVAFLITVGIAVVIGLVMGSLISYFKLAPFIITLAFQTIGRGVAYMFTSGQPVRLTKTEPSHVFMVNFGSQSDPLLGVPWPVWLLIVITVIFILIMRYTAFGRKIIAIGSNEEAVRLSGIKVNKYKIAAYMISSGLAAMAGILITSRAAIGTAVAAQGYELDAIAGCVIGGASLSGGKGSVVMTIIGILTLGLIGNIMNLMSIATYPQSVIKGVIIIAAVLLQTVTDKSKAV